MPAASFFSLFHLLEPPMRPLVLIAIPLLALAACGDKDQADTGRNAGAGLTAANIVANDITAIDAVTADAANMAADIDYADALANLSNNGVESNVSGSAKAKAKRTVAAPPPSSRPAKPADSTTNSE